jgi:hypothetical protein
MTWLLALLPAPWLAALKLVPWRLIGFIAAAIVATWLWVTVMHWRDDSHALPKVKAEVTQLRAEKAAQKVAYDAAVKEAARITAANEKVAREVENGLREKISAGDAAGRSLSQRLRDYQASLSRCRALPAAAGDAGQPAGTSGVPGRDEEVERLSDGAWAACSRDSVRLDAIEAWRAGLASATPATP